MTLLHLEIFILQPTRLMSGLRKGHQHLPFLPQGLRALRCWSYRDAESWLPSLADGQPEHTPQAFSLLFLVLFQNLQSKKLKFKTKSIGILD